MDIGIKIDSSSISEVPAMITSSEEKKMASESETMPVTMNRAFDSGSCESELRIQV